MMRKVPFNLYGWLVVVLLANGVGGCGGSLSDLSPTPPTLGLASPTGTSVPVSPSPTHEVITMTPPTTPGTPDQDPTEAAQLEEQKAALLARLNPTGAGAGQPLQPATPLLPAEELGAVQAIAFEQSDPFLSLSFYIYPSKEAQRAGMRLYLQQGSQRLPAQTKATTLATDLTFMVAYYFTDNSRGDSRQAASNLREILRPFAEYE